MSRTYCSSCFRHFRLKNLTSTAAIARHNIECAETGERSYVGHAPYRSLEQEQANRDIALLLRIDRMRARGLAVAERP